MNRILLLIIICLVVMFTTNAYAGLIVYDGGGTAGIQGAMADLGLAFTLRGPGVPVTAADLDSATALIVGWNAGGNMGGLSESVLAAGIGGNILITGHDADYHTAYSTGAIEDAATLFLRQAIGFAEEQGGTGLVALGDFSTGFSYLPSSWGLSTVSGLAGTGDEPIGITAAGLASGVYDGLIDTDMSPWYSSYHNEFTAFESRFEVFEEHYSMVGTPITIGYVVPVPVALLLGVLGLSVAGVKLRKLA